MVAKNSPASPAQDRQLVITRVFDAPRELVFKAWTDPEHLERWYAPKGCTTTIRKLEFRRGGVFHHCIRNPRVGDCWCKGAYREIVVPERIVYTLAITDEKETLSSPWMSGWTPTGREKR